MARGEYGTKVGRGGGGGHGGGGHGGGGRGGHGRGRGGWGGWGWGGWGGWGWPYYGYGWPYYGYGYDWPAPVDEGFPHWRSPRAYLARHRRRVHYLLGQDLE